VKILIAEDDMISRRLLEKTLIRWGYEVAVTCDGTAAWEVLQGADAPPLAILDWMMPGTDGIEAAVESDARHSRHLSGFSSRRKEVGRYRHGLRSGQRLFTKPLTAKNYGRVCKGMHREATQLSGLRKRPEEALARVKQLQGLLPICSLRKKIRDDRNYWHRSKAISPRALEAQSASICPDCCMA
jgi:DNA-binding response OmpR family regulator